MSNQDISKSFIQSLKTEKEDLREINLSNAEIILDNIINDDFLEKIPVFKYLYGGYKFTVGIKEGFLLKKLARFLFKTSEIPTHEKDSFIQKLNADEKFQSKVVEKTLIILDKLDEINKVDICAKLFESLVKGNIDLAKYLRLIHIVEQVFLEDLQVVIKMYHNSPVRTHSDFKQDFELEQDEASILVGLGLVTNRFEINTQFGGGDLLLHYNLSEHAIDLVRFGLDLNNH